MRGAHEQGEVAGEAEGWGGVAFEVVQVVVPGGAGLIEREAGQGAGPVIPFEQEGAIPSEVGAEIEVHSQWMDGGAILDGSEGDRGDFAPFESFEQLIDGGAIAIDGQAQQGSGGSGQEVSLESFEGGARWFSLGEGTGETVDGLAVAGGPDDLGERDGLIADGPGKAEHGPGGLEGGEVIVVLGGLEQLQAKQVEDDPNVLEVRKVGIERIGVGGEGEAAGSGFGEFEGMLHGRFRGFELGIEGLEDRGWNLSLGREFGQEEEEILGAVLGREIVGKVLVVAGERLGWDGDGPALWEEFEDDLDELNGVGVVGDRKAPGREGFEVPAERIEATGMGERGGESRVCL